MKFTEMLSERWQNAGSMLCVGLDPNPTRFPHELAGRSTALYDFCCGIIDATADLVCAFKPQIAYFASCGAEAELKAVIDYIHANHPKVPLLVPGIGAQGGDIRACVEAGKTAEGTGMVINSGRAIIYASREDDWKEAARKTAIATRDSIQAAV